MDPKEYELIIASIVAGFTGVGAFLVSYQELLVHQDQVRIDQERLAMERSNSTIEATTAAWEIDNYQCDAAREIYAIASPDPAIPGKTREALSRWAGQKLLECTK